VSALVPAVVLVLVTAAMPTDSTVSAPPVTVTAVNKAAPFTGALTLRIHHGDLTGVVVEDTRYDEPGWALTGPAGPALTATGDAEGTVKSGATFVTAAAGNGLGTTRVGRPAGTLTLTLTSL
jgi:hypothetical protein